MPVASEQFGVISISRLMEGFLEGAAAKFSTLWFDRLLFEDYWNSKNVHVAGALKPSFNDWIAGKLVSQGAKPDTIRFLQDRWMGISDSHQEHKYILGPFDELPVDILNVIDKTVDEEITQPLTMDGVHPIDIDKETYAATRNMKEMVARTLFAPTDTTIVSGRLTQKTLESISTSLARNTSEAAHIMIRSQVPDFAELSWEDIAEMCHHSHYERFRTKMRELHEVRKAGSIQEASQICTDIFQNSIRQLVQSTRTKSLDRNIVEGIIGNLTPIGWAFAYRDIFTQKQIDDSTGWVYFVLDLEDSAKNQRQNNAMDAKPPTEHS